MSRLRITALLLALVTLLVYLPVGRHDFVNYDDTDYVTENSFVKSGLTWVDAKWAFIAFHSGNWHPITWLSHMADCEFFGLNPGAHHFVNALLHAANVALLFILFLRLTGLFWPAAFNAALFAWHPLHVESVAWISERKDVLSTFFELLALLCYARFAEKSKALSSSSVLGSARNSKPDVFYTLALAMFALGLMSKPMIVTLPFVMLLLDYWPLRRFSPSTFCLAFLLEKWPFFLLAAISCVITFLAQRAGAAVVSLEIIPLHLRLENALVAYPSYLLKLFWPENLAVIYPLPKLYPLWQLMLAIAALIFISWLVWYARKFAYLPVGWLWFLGTLLPVIGIVQVGSQAMADRYSYFPSIGIFIAVAFGVNDMENRYQFPKIALTMAAVLMLAGCLFLAENQLGYWHDSEALFRHALAVTKNNDIAHLNLGAALQKRGDWNGALAEYCETERLAPGGFLIHGNIGSVLDDLGRPEAAMAEYQEALRINPNQPKIHDGIGITLVEMNRFNEAMRQFAEAARLNANDPWPHFQMGQALLKQGHDAEAISQFRESLRLDPDNFQILAYAARVLSADENTAMRDGQAALTYAARANILVGGQHLFVIEALGMAYAETGDYSNAVEAAKTVVGLATATKMKNLEPMQQRLQLYENHQPWRESFLATNMPAKILPNN
jgi:tetratricopeptide (TPR) repeat protein